MGGGGGWSPWGGVGSTSGKIGVYPADLLTNQAVLDPKVLESTAGGDRTRVTPIKVAL